ncbi:hypothetical protein RYX36_033281 [Vicia faba]
MATSSSKRDSSSSSSRWHNFSTRISTSLASASLEWLLILFLFINVVLSYVITKFSSYCKLKAPCLFCSRIDHVLGKEKNGYYLDLICSYHKSEISSLVYCCKHDKLVNIQVNEGVSVPVHGRDDTEKDVRVMCQYMELCSAGDSNEDLTSGKLGTLASVFESLLSESRMQVENIHVDGIKTVAAAVVESGNGLTELKWHNIERSVVCPSSSEATPFNNVPTLSSKIRVHVEVSKENDDFRIGEEGLMSKQGPTVDSEENINSGNKLITSKGGLESTLVSSDIGQQNLNSLDLGYAYKLAIGNRGRQLSGMLAEHWLEKDSSRVNEDLKILMSQFSATRGTDMSFNDISPRLSINSEEAKSSDVSNSTGMQILQKTISLERNESGLSLDGSIVGEIKGESLVDKLKRPVDHDRKLMNALYKELEEERNASAIAVSQALAMITRL